jgi:carboxypeptidase D
MSGLLTENGPVNWMPGTFKPVANPWSWHHLSNVIWVDQPLGTGFDIGNATEVDETDVADQFRGFWKNFVDTFDIQNYSIYIAGESYAGLYCPYIAGGMVDQNDTEYFDVTGMIIYDGIYSDMISDAFSVPFVEYWGGLFPFNDTFRDAIHAAHESCYADDLAQYLVYPPSGVQPYNKLPGVNDNQTDYLPGCELQLPIEEAIMLLNPCFNIYEVNAVCPLPYDPLGFTFGFELSPAGAPTIWFNRTDVKEALHVPVTEDWSVCKDGVLESDNSVAPIVVQIPKVIEATHNVIIGHGALDMILHMNRTMLAIQNMTWGGQLGFQQMPVEPFFVPYHDNPDPFTAAGMGVFGTTHTERGLTYVTVTLSGHQVSGFQQAAGYRHLEVLLGRVPDLQSTEPFTTDVNNTVQPTGPLGFGTGPQLFAGP